MGHLFRKLGEYGRGDIYPYHMPGHKRRPWGELPEEMYLRDITEIDGFDNLCQPEGILRSLQERAAALYGAGESFYLVNGSTAGILSAVSAALPTGGRILMARNSHRSAYHAAYLRHLSISYLYPPMLKGHDILDGITPKQVREALDREPDTGAVLVVSPTYEGRISDIRGIAETVHEKNIPLIVDEAHGAHLGFSEEFAENSCQAGADLVIHSVHKTLPALTQTALLHVNGNRVDKDLLRRFLHIYQSSSPSYLLMASIDNALQYLGEAGADAFAAFAGNYKRLLADLQGCKHLHFLPPVKGRQDIGKLLISVKNTKMSGKQLYDTLLNKHKLQLEMAAETYALAMFTVNDSVEGYERMRTALLQIDAELDGGREHAAGEGFPAGEEFFTGGISSAGKTSDAGTAVSVRELYSAGAIPLARAWDMERRYVGLGESAGHYAGEFVNLYPPGVPLLVPGEWISPQMIADIRRYLTGGLNVLGLKIGEGGIRICILDSRMDRGRCFPKVIMERREDRNMKKTKIICTIGPASESEERLRELMLAGMDVARFNFSHGTHEEQKVKYQRVLKVRGELGLPVATLLDTKGPEIRLRDFQGGKAELKAGQRFVLTTEDILGTSERAAISYKNLKDDISVGTTILIDDGLIEMTVEEINGGEIVCRVVNGGYVSNHKGVNVPGAVLSMPYISDVDREDILFGIEMGFEFLAASFVRTREDIEEIRGILKEHGSEMKIIAKIENMQGIQNLEEILNASDGIMVARGDMGVEIPLEEVPAFQKKMIKMANAQGKHVITATQMLESMMKNPRPTRAEATDIANAIYDGTTAIMLSGESAAGLYPVEAVKTMAKIAASTEKDIDYRGRMKQYDTVDRTDITMAIAYSTCTAAADLNASAIITVTMSGFTAEAISRFKPVCPVIGCTVNDRVCKQLNLLWGVSPLHIGRKESSDELFAAALEEAKRAGYVKQGDTVVITAGVPLGIAGKTNMIHVVEVE